MCGYVKRTIFVFLVMVSLWAVAEDVTLKTEDGVTLSCDYLLPGDDMGKLPAVVLIHQGGSHRGEWGDFPNQLLQKGYAVFAYDVRGHGLSDKVEDIYSLFNDPNQAPKDLLAVLAFLRKQPRIDATRLAVVGSSIGSNLACVASSEMGIKTAVAMSGKTSAVYNLAGKKDLKLASIFHISSELDGGGKRAVWARQLFDSTAEPRQLQIVKGSQAHGVSIFNDEPDLPSQIIKWLADTL